MEGSEVIGLGFIPRWNRGFTEQCRFWCHSTLQDVECQVGSKRCSFASPIFEIGAVSVTD
jgi:hypothetical protein